MRRSHEVIERRVLALALALALPGCGATVVGGGGTVEEPDVPDAGGVVAPGGDEPSAVAMRFGAWTPPPPSNFFSFSTSGPTPPDPNALVLFYASEAQACAQPHLDLGSPSVDPAVCAEQAFWQLIVVIPPERAQPGVIDLQDMSIDGYRSTWGEDCGGGSGSGPGIIQGTLTITSIDATKVVTKLDLAPSTGWKGESGDYTAAFCP